MQLEITRDNVRDLAGRLQRSLGTADPENAVKRSAAYEAIAALLGCANWDTLSGLLGREAAANTATRRPLVRLFGEVRPTVDDCDSPSWVEVSLDADLIRAVIDARDLCRREGLNYLCRPLDSDLTWHESNVDRGEFLNVRDAKLLVSQADFWIRGFPKHAEYAVELRRINVDELVNQLDSGLASAGCFARVGADRVLRSGSGSVFALADALLDAGVLTEEEVEAATGTEKRSEEH